MSAFGQDQLSFDFDDPPKGMAPRPVKTRGLQRCHGDLGKATRRREHAPACPAEQDHHGWFERVRRDPTLPLSAVTLARCLAGGGRFTRWRLCELTGNAPATIPRAVKRLEQAGWLRVDRTRGRVANVYQPTFAGGAP